MSIQNATRLSVLGIAKSIRVRIRGSIADRKTGPGNVAKAFTGTTKLKPTIKKVNTMSSKKVYSELRRKLPYKETRDYLSKVTNRMPYYNSYN